MLTLRVVMARRAVRVGSITVAVLIAVNSELAQRNIAPFWDIQGVRLYVTSLTSSLQQLDAEPTLIIGDDVVLELIVPNSGHHIRSSCLYSRQKLLSSPTMSMHNLCSQIMVLLIQ